MHASSNERRFILLTTKIGLCALLAVTSACATSQAGSTDSPPDRASPASAPAAGDDTKPAEGAGGAPAESNGAKSAQDSGQWLQKLMARELDLPSSAVEYDSGQHSGSVLSRELLKVERAEGLTYIGATLGTATPIECYIYDGAMDVASSINGVGRQVMNAVGQSHGGIEVIQPASIDAGAMGAFPFLYVTWVYRAKGSGAGPTVGILKQMAVMTDHQVTICHHNEPGYDKAFRQWMAHLATNYRNKNGSVQYRLLEVSKDEVNGSPVGLSVVRVKTDGDGDFRRETFSAFLGRRGTEVLAMDRATVEFTDADGRLISGGYFDSQGTDLSVKQVATGYEVTGKHVGKDVRFEVAADAPACTATRVERELAKMLRAPGQQTYVCHTFFSGSPDKLVEVKATEREAVNPMAFGLEMGPMSMTVFYDGPNKPVSTELQAGPATIKSVMVYREGQP